MSTQYIQSIHIHIQYKYMYTSIIDKQPFHCSLQLCFNMLLASKPGPPSQHGVYLPIENNRLVPWMEKVYLARRRNLLGEPKANPINSVAEPDKLSTSKALTCYSIYPVISLNNKKKHLYVVFSHFLKGE